MSIDRFKIQTLPEQVGCQDAYYEAKLIDNKLSFIIFCSGSSKHIDYRSDFHDEFDLKDILYDMRVNSGISKEYVNFVRKIHSENCGYSCPECGWDCSDDDTGENIIEEKNRSYNMYISMEYGGAPYDWLEIWKCPMCIFEFEIENGNY